MFGSHELALAAYHTGPAYVIKHKQPAPCSKKYISVIMKDYYWLKAHTDPAVIRHNAQKEQAKKQAQEKAQAEAKARAEAEAKARIQSDKLEANAITDEMLEQANAIIEASAEIQDYLSSRV